MLDLKWVLVYLGQLLQVEHHPMEIKQEGIISDVNLKTDKSPKTLEGVELIGDETFDELKYISEYGVHPRDLDPTEGFAQGGIVSLT